MIPPKYPENEANRQAAVEKYQLLDTLPDEVFDNITHLIAYLCDTPISLITLMDKERNFLKSHHGVELSESPRAISFCGHLLCSEDDVMIVEDARKDIRFHDNPLVTEFSAIFYAGAPLVDPDGFRLGTLCVYDHRPRKLTREQLDALQRMSQQVIALMVSNFERIQLESLQKRLKDKYETLSKFAHTVSHDLKSPLNQFIGLIDLIELEEKEHWKEPTVEYFTHLKKSAASLRTYIDGMLAYYEKDKLLLDKKENISIKELMHEIDELTRPAHESRFTFEAPFENLHCNKSVVMHILINLVINSFKYNHKEVCRTHVTVDETATHYVFCVEDNGDGIPEEALPGIFDIFTIGVLKDRSGTKGTGIGLASVKKLVESCNGEIRVESALEEGSRFTFTLLK